ncbi:MAG TPA: ORF6N domain-containing protein [Phycisphaerae bacterium]
MIAGQVHAGHLNEAIRRNCDRFPGDFMFQLTKAEYENLRCQSGTPNLKSQIAISRPLSSASVGTKNTFPRSSKPFAKGRPMGYQPKSMIADPPSAMSAWAKN